MSAAKEPFYPARSGQYTLDGHTPVRADSLLAWARWLEDNGPAMEVAFTEIRSGTETLQVHTFFLGLDFNFHRGRLPALFETSVLENGEYSDEGGQMYPTWEAAKAGHKAVVAAVCATLGFVEADSE